MSEYAVSISSCCLGGWFRGWFHLVPHGSCMCRFCCVSCVRNRLRIGNPWVELTCGVQKRAWFQPGSCLVPPGSDLVPSLQTFCFTTVPAWFRLAPPGFQTVRLFRTSIFFAGAQKRQPWTKTVEEFGARLLDICDHINTHFDVEGLCEGLPSRVQNLGRNPEGSALFLLGMRSSIAHAMPRHAPEGCCGDMWGVKLKAGPEPA